MRNLLIIAVAIFFAGCSFRPELPNVDTNFEATYQLITDIKDRWWEEFGDENLNVIVEEALNNNIDLKIAFLNLQKAEASLGIASADLFPSVNLNAGATRARTSGETYTKQDNVKYTNHSLNFGLNYEIDLWGRVKNSIEASKSSLKASKFDYDSARLTIASNIAKSYFTLVALNMREKVLSDTLKNYEEIMKFRKTQLEFGSVDNITFLQSKAQVDSAKASLVDIKNSISLALNSLSIMSGKSNDEILKGVIKSSKKLPKEPEVKAGISADILLRRSDVASAYETLKGTNALVGVSRAAYYPSISLTGLFGFVSEDLARLFVSNATNWSLGGSLTQKIFDHGRIKNNVKIAETNEQIAALNYEKTIKTALGEVKNALISRQNAKLSEQSIKELLNSQQKIYKIAKSKFDEGYSSHLELLDAQRNLLATELQNISANLNVINSVVEIYKAFGGGFKLESELK
ncbi:efflux transporter outer membrane subunit [Campylobacter sp. RM16187]|uniref:efflux transporter outer membrane subunit n=1 Tax=Campylobacter sp. RM16187 TaxID=1660063 RepID=UPI0021B635F5|nr:TolC family protein [Campylobacter sp. RM16187]QKG28472.1 multidrug efflux system CmeABC, outer membrane lipoprotein CmeC [Campylobacter sp. RM16187]